jgi:hypothetical protein
MQKAIAAKQKKRSQPQKLPSRRTSLTYRAIAG